MTLLLIYLLGFIFIMIFYGFLAVGLGIAFALRNIVVYIIAGLLSSIGLLVLNITISYFYGPIVGLYYDLLIRKEGYDIQQQLAEDDNLASSETG